MKNKALAVLLFLFPIVVQIPFSILAMKFGYPDVLRKDAGTVLTNYNNLGSGIIWTWYIYAVSIILFLAANVLISQKISKRFSIWLFTLGTISGTIQLIALLRWVFLVPLLARAYVDAENEASRHMITLLFEVQNSYLGIGLGEHLGQATMVAWTIILTINLVPKRTRLRWLGYASGTALAIGLTEHLTTVFQNPIHNLDKVTAVGFILWSVWLIGLGWHFIHTRKDDALILST